MLKRRNAVLAFLLVAVMLLGVGFAALEDTLTVKTTASVKVTSDPVQPGDPEPPKTPAEEDFDEKVYFSAVDQQGIVKPTSAAQGATVTATASEDMVTITINENVMNIKDDAVVVTATIKNDSAYNVAVTLNDDFTTDSGNFKVTSAWDGSTGTIAANGGTANVKITVTLLKALTTNVNAEEFSVTYSVAPVA